MNRKLFSMYVLRETMGLAVMGAALFISAGRIDWWQAWAAILVMFFWIAATGIILVRYHPDLLAERLGPRKGAKSWDVTIMSIVGLLQLVRYIVAGLDHRFGWTSGITIAAELIALILCALGYAMVVWATATNAFFSQIVRIQSERGHSVVTDGPYRYVRHPAYLGSILFELAVPILLGSWWALFVSIFSAGLLLLRTNLEDRTLQLELDRYEDYTQQVKYRLIPYVW